MTAADAQAALAGTWQVTFVRDAAIPGDVVPLLIFEPERIGVFAGCNGFSVPLTYLPDGELRLGPAQLNTRASCGEAAMAVESQVVRALERINAASGASEGKLALTAFGTVMMEAVRQP